MTKKRPRWKHSDGRYQNRLYLGYNQDTAALLLYWNPDKFPIRRLDRASLRTLPNPYAHFVYPDLPIPNHNTQNELRI